jgi:hypothetical protein
MYEIVIHKRGPTPKLLARELNSVNRETARLMGDYWHQRFFPKHFTHRGATEYGYKKRNEFYEAKKLKKFGHTYPLVFSGEGKEQASHPRIVATAKRGEARVRVIMNAPVFNFRSSPNAPNMAEELRTISEPEANELGREAGFFQQYLFSKLRGRTETIRAA